MAKRLLVMAGGTGGHVFPGLAVADLLTSEGWEILWLGTRQRMEASLVPDNGYDIRFIDVQGVRGNGLVRLLSAPFKICQAIFQAKRIIKQWQPDVVLGMGGFAAGPGGVAAKMQGIPLVVHEQNASAGLTNRLLMRLATRVLTGFDGAFARCPTARWVGNPLRAMMQPKALHEVPHQPLRVLVVGGSLGAQALNQAVPDCLAQLDVPLEIKHQCGKDRAVEVTQRYSPQSLVEVMDFINDMAEAYRWADLVICRAGALTVSEIAQIGVAAIFVPLPGAVDDHQAKNASVMVAAGAAKMVRQGQQWEQQLLAVLKDMSVRPERLKKMAEAARLVAKPKATSEVAGICKELAGVNR